MIKRSSLFRALVALYVVPTAQTQSWRYDFRDVEAVFILNPGAISEIFKTKNTPAYLAIG